MAAGIVPAGIGLGTDIAPGAEDIVPEPVDTGPAAGIVLVADMTAAVADIASADTGEDIAAGPAKRPSPTTRRQER